jgi:hypothetical protein
MSVQIYKISLHQFHKPVIIASYNIRSVLMILRCYVHNTFSYILRENVTRNEMRSI